ncbi:MAG TPA: FadR/GntR family transcriptional regulator [Caballeronia sp.]|nr:GntR family transcriptional regulator, transcriptional repressor for pyruvate dehydrogenase complex [Caballeronia sp.]HEV7836160.1 FadR/GntR family transcriptional regulator [Caballeronia sp.]
MQRPTRAVFETPAYPHVRRSLTTELVDALRQQIETAELKVGARLATEAEMVQRFNVSRTVVREALSKLQAAGLVETRHGIGTFVCEAPGKGLFQLDPADVAGSIDALAVLELRISLETESAGLAAARRDAARIAAMRRALSDFERNVGEANGTISPDIRFHLEIAHATGNRYFVDIMTHLGSHMIPRTRLTATQIPAAQYADYLTRVNREHEQICDAIERGDMDSARTAMRLHLINSRERLRRAQEGV